MSARRANTFKLDPRIDRTLDLFAKLFPEKVDGKEHPTRPTGKKVNGYGLRQLIHGEIARALATVNIPERETESDQGTT